MLGNLTDLVKALEAGQYNAAPSTLTQGAALQIEDLSPVMELVAHEDQDITLQKNLSIKDAKGTLVQFNRQLDYGTFGGSAQYEGGIGEEDTSSIVRVTVPMAYYSTLRRVSVQANLIQAFDGVKAEDRAANDAAMKLSSDIEFDSFRGQTDFSNAGVFDGNPLAIPSLPGMIGVDAQIRMSDSQANTQDLMFAEYGSSDTVVLSVNGAMNQTVIEDGAVRSRMNHGRADKLILDPISLSQYNKIAFAKERIVLAGAPQEATGASLRTQWTSSSLVSLEASRFVSGKSRPARPRSGSPAAPTFTSSATGSNGVIEAGSYIYFVTAVNERGESIKSSDDTVSVAAGNRVELTIAAVSGAKYFNVYRSEAGGTSLSAGLIGKVKASGSGSTVFVDLGNRKPRSVTGFLLQTNTMNFYQMSAYSRLKLAMNDLSMPEAHFRFLCVAVKQPRKNVLFENVDGQL